MDATNLNDAPTEGLWERARDSGMTRRKFLFLLAAGGVAAVLAACTPGGVKTAPTPTPAPTIFEALQFFDRGQAAIVNAATGRIIPGTPQDPGAKEAGVVIFIDEALDGYDSALQRDYIIGLDGIEAYAKSKYAKGFVELTDQQQDEILTNMQQNSAEAKQYLPNPAGFFGTLLTHTRQGMFSDPIYGGNRNDIGWKLLGHPGIVFGHDLANQKCDVEFPKEYMGSQEYYETHPS